MPTPTITNESVAQLLDDALALMNKKGAHWLQGSYNGFNEQGEASYCSVGALRASAANKSIDALLAAESVLQEEIKNISYSSPEARIVRWNDAQGRKWEDVSKAFKTAARKLRRRKTAHPSVVYFGG